MKTFSFKKRILLVPFLGIFSASMLFTNILSGQSLGPWIKTSLDPGGLGEQMSQVVVIDNVLYATGWKGLWKKTNGEDEWIKIKEFSIATSFLKHKGQYYIGTWRDGVWRSDDLLEWTVMPLPDGYNITSLATDQNDLYCSADDGIFKLNEATNSFEIESLTTASSHNNFFYSVLMTEDFVIALGCDFMYFKSKDSIDWDLTGRQFERCGLTAENINGIVYLATSGAGVFQFVPGVFIIQPYTSPNAEELKHVISIYPYDQAIYYLFLTGLYSSEGYREEINGNFLTDIVYYEGAFYVSTANDGIWKSTGIIPRNEGVTSFEFDIVPTLSSGDVQLQLSNAGPQVYNIAVMDVQGRVIQSHSINNQYNLYNISKTIRIEEPGLYYIRCNTNNEIVIKKVVIF